MAGLFPDPFRYVLDTSALVDLKRNYQPAVFKTVWNRFNALCDSRAIISCREVYNEIKRGSDWLLDWVDVHEAIFLTPATAEEAALIGSLQERYPFWIDPNSDRPAADPFVIACAAVHHLPIIQHELANRHLPRVAKEMSLECIRLDDFFVREGWEF